jgi:hypothetical protein
MEELNIDISHAEVEPERQDKIKSLILSIDQQPDNEVPILKLASEYAQIWAKTHDPEFLMRVLFCLEKAIAVSSGRFESQTRKIIDGVRKRAENLGMMQVLERLRVIEEKLAARLAVIAAEEEASGMNEAAGPALDMAADAEVTIETADANAEAAVEEASSGEAIPEPTGGVPAEWDEASGVDSADEEEAPDTEQVAQNIEVAEKLKSMVDEGHFTEVIHAYTGLNDAAVKRSVVDKIINTIPEYGIEPILALASVEDDKQVFRYLMRTLLRADRATILEDIDLASYSDDLQNVGIVVLSRLGLRGAVDKLKQALFMENILVRSVAVHGLATTGTPSEETLHLLAETAEKDPHTKVRVAAAKALQTADSPDSFYAFYRHSLDATYDSAVDDVLEAMAKKFDPDGEVRQEIDRSVLENREVNKKEIKRKALENTEKARVKIKDDMKPWYKRMPVTKENIEDLQSRLKDNKKALVIFVVIIVVLIGGVILLWPTLKGALDNTINLLQASFPGLKSPPVD